MANKINKMSKLIVAAKSINRAIESLSVVDDHDLVAVLETVKAKLTSDIGTIINNKINKDLTKEVKQQ